MLRRHPATYRRCTDCGFVFVVDPTWLDEAYDSAIAKVDLGCVDRVMRYSRSVKLVLHFFLDPKATCLDYGAGYGLFVRRMRDLGYDFRWYDKHCENLFAQDFVGALDARYELLTAFEVMEHLVDPLAELDAWSRLADNIVASTMLVERYRAPPLDEWVYYAPETGQHIGFFSIETLRRVASRLGLHLSSDGYEFHMFSKRPMSPALFRIVTYQRRARLAALFYSRPTLLPADFTNARRNALRESPRTGH